jgi:hypothetical protein
VSAARPTSRPRYYLRHGTLLICLGGSLKFIRGSGILDIDGNFEHAEALIGATIHEEIRRRAIDGWDVPIFYQGKQSGSIGKYSDRLLLLLAKAHCPEFRHYATAEHCGQPDVRVRVEFADIEPNDARRERVIERAQKNFGVRPVQCGGLIVELWPETSSTC